MDFLTFILFLCGFVLLIVGAEFLVRGASQLAIAIGISPLVVGLTVVAYGTSAPELAVTVQATYSGQADIAIGNVVGSNISNILLVMGLSAIIAPLVIAKQLVRLDIPLMIALSFVMLFFGFDGKISRLDGILLFVGAISYTTFLIWQSRKENKQLHQEYKQEFEDDVALTHAKGLRPVMIQFGLILIGLVMLVLGAKWLIDGSVQVAQWLGVSELVIGLTIVAIGTSLPEIATSMVASFRGSQDIAAGNLIGSNIFNILSVLGLCAIVAPDGITVSSRALQFDIVIMTAVAIVCLPFALTEYKISRIEGGVFLGYYLIYGTYLFLWAINHPYVPTINNIMLYIILPLTAIAVAYTTFKHLKNEKQQPVTT